MALQREASTRVLGDVLDVRIYVVVFRDGRNFVAQAVDLRFSRVTPLR